MSDLSEMKVSELREYAAANDVNIKGLKSKADIIAAIESAQSQDEPVAVLATTFEPAVITADWAGMRERLAEMIAPYDGLTADVVAGMDIREAKLCRADLKKMSNELNEARKAIKREYNKPLAEFEAKVKELDALILGPWRLLDEGIKLEEERAREARRAALETAYEEYAPALYPVVPPERIIDPAWLNKGFGEVKAEEAMIEKVSAIAHDWDALSKADLKFPVETEAEFFRTLSLRSALDYDFRRSEEQSRIDAMKADVADYSAQEPDECFDPPEADAVDQAVAPMEPLPVWEPPTNDVAGQIADFLRTFPLARQKAVLDGLITLQSPSAKAPTPRVMVIPSATTEQCIAIGKFCGLIGVTGTFMGGTLQEAARRDESRQTAMGQVMQYGA